MDTTINQDYLIKLKKERSFFNEDSCDAYYYDTELYNQLWMGEEEDQWEADFFLEFSQSNNRVSFYNVEQLDEVLNLLTEVKEEYNKAKALAEEKNGKETTNDL